MLHVACCGCGSAGETAPLATQSAPADEPAAFSIMSLQPPPSASEERAEAPSAATATFSPVRSVASAAKVPIEAARLAGSGLGGMWMPCAASLACLAAADAAAAPRRAGAGAIVDSASSARLLAPSASVPAAIASAAEVVVALGRSGARSPSGSRSSRLFPAFIHSSSHSTFATCASSRLSARCACSDVIAMPSHPPRAAP
mmetsp:Transcript_22221/g.51091  ORF Transcript_22221/g.51091 Transcript_22221/m.51091 type:complete len:201 (-) Transcript_22221:14-616(-)